MNEKEENKIWSKYEDEEIDSEYKKHRIDILEIFENFKYLNAFKNPLKCKNKFLIKF